MNKYVLHNTGNCIHYLAKTNNGEESKKEYVFTYNTSIKSTLSFIQNNVSQLYFSKNK